jgi:uncharacterized protein (DUF1015 family)
MRIRTGVIAAVSAEPFGRGRVRPHERTHAAPKADRLQLLRATHTALEPLFFLAPDEDGALDERLATITTGPPWAGAALGRVSIQLWQVTGSEARALAREAGASCLYVADGHHRYETAVSFAQEFPQAGRVPALIVPVRNPGLTVMATHRLICGGGPEAHDLLEQLRRHFQIRELQDGTNLQAELENLQRRGTACLLGTAGGSWLALLLKGRPSVDAIPFAETTVVASLDVARVDALVVEPLRRASGGGGVVAYSADIDDVQRQLSAGAAEAAVLLNPTPVEQVMAVADAGAVMPPKSTYFFPKVPGGLVLLPYD